MTKCNCPIWLYQIWYPSYMLLLQFHLTLQWINLVVWCLWLMFVIDALVWMVFFFIVKDLSVYKIWDLCTSWTSKVNAEKVAVSGKKRIQKLYRRHSGRPGGMTVETFDQLQKRIPERIIEHAVRGMLPKGRVSCICFTYKNQLIAYHVLCFYWQLMSSYAIFNHILY